jgi:hypothetical protein
MARKQATNESAWTAALWPFYFIGRAGFLLAVAFVLWVVLPLHHRAWRPIDRAEQATALRARADQSLKDAEVAIVPTRVAMTPLEWMEQAKHRGVTVESWIDE